TIEFVAQHRRSQGGQVHSNLMLPSGSRGTSHERERLTPALKVLQRRDVGRRRQATTFGGTYLHLDLNLRLERPTRRKIDAHGAIDRPPHDRKVRLPYLPLLERALENPPTRQARATGPQAATPKEHEPRRLPVQTMGHFPSVLRPH